MKKTVLELVQKTLSTMDSDAVDSINDTEESSQIAELLEDIYYEILERDDWDHLRGALTVTAVATAAAPTTFNLDEDIMELELVQYNVADAGDPANMRELTYLEPQTFLRKYSSGNDSTDEITLSGGLIAHIRNDQMPIYWTSFDDESIVLNSYDSNVESTATTARIACLGLTTPAFSTEDTHIPDLPLRMFPHLQATLNAASHLYYKQQASPVDESRVRRQMSQLRRKGARTKQGSNPGYPNKFGRK